MKYRRKTAVVLAVALVLTGCGQKDSVRMAENGNSVEKAISDQMAADDKEQSAAEISSEETEQVTTEQVTTEQQTNAVTIEDTEQKEAENSSVEEPKDADKNSEEPESVDTDADAEPVDYDLTNMNSDMVYATVYQMMVDPEPYLGKTVKMSGPFYPYTNLDGTVYYPACIIEDALACCAQGMEFVLTDGVYPDDYPEWGTTITVTGTFETYEEDEYVLCHLVNATLITGNP